MPPPAGLSIGICLSLWLSVSLLYTYLSSCLSPAGFCGCLSVARLSVGCLSVYLPPLFVCDCLPCMSACLLFVWLSVQRRSVNLASSSLFGCLSPPTLWLSVYLAFLYVCCPFVSLPPVILSASSLSFFSLLHPGCPASPFSFCVVVYLRSA
jgi:hypothetical protein